MKLGREGRLQNWVRLVGTLGTVGLLATGCQTYKQQNKTIGFWRQGDLNAAVIEAKKQADENAKNKDAIVWRLEQGAVLRAAGKFDDSNAAFDQAQRKIDDYAQKAKVRVAQETGAMLSNQAELDYEGRSYDGIMLNTYRALNFLALGQVDKARPELIRAYERQQDAVEANKKRIEKAREAATKSDDHEAIEKAQKDEKLKTQLKGVTADLNSIKVYADYVNPFSVYLDGIYFLANAADTSDLERAHKSLERVAAFAPNNAYVKDDLMAADDALNGHPLKPTTYVIFETGCAPIRDQIRIDIPIIISKVSYVGAAFPTLKPQDNYLPTLSVATSSTNLTTALVGSMDGVIALDFKNELPVVITKTLASTIIKATAAYAANQAAQKAGGDWAGLVSQIATAGYQMAVNIADTRTWTTLPKEFQVARFPTPADHKITVSGPGGTRTEISLSGDGINLVCIKSISATTPLLVTQCQLNAAPLHVAAHSGAAPSSSANPEVVTSAAAAVPNNHPAIPESKPAPAAPLPSAPAPLATPVRPPPTAPVAGKGLGPEITPVAATNAPATPSASLIPPLPMPAAPVPAVAVAAFPAVPEAPVPPAPAVTPAPFVPAVSVSTTPAKAPVPAPAAPDQTAVLAKISDPQVHYLCETLRSDKPQEVVEALRTLRRMDATEAVALILPCLNHYDPAVIREACRALAVVGGKDTIPHLQPLLQDHREDVRRDAQFAIKDLEGKPDSSLLSNLH